MKYKQKDAAFAGGTRHLSNKVYLYFLFLLILLLIITYMLVGTSKLKVGVVGFSQEITNDKSSSLAYNWLQNNSPFEPVYISMGELSDETLGDIDVLWIHQEDSLSFNQNELPHQSLELLKTYMDEGGRILLTQESVLLIQALELETEPPQIEYVTAEDGGYGRKMGLHAFLDHPVFNGLHGGAFIFGPQEDVRCRQIGYFGDNKPQNGQTIAIDWAYIQLKEQSRLMLEFEHGDGKAISIGSYMLLGIANQQQLQMDRFLVNTINYLAADELGAGDFWSYEEPKVRARVAINDSGYNYLPDSSWQVPDMEQTPQLFSSTGKGDYIEASGRRILLVGQESGGIEEIWAHPFMALRDYEACISIKDSLLWLNQQKPEVWIYPGMFLRQYKFHRAYLREWVAVSPNKPQVVIKYEYRGVYPAQLHYRFRSNLRRMWPYSEQTTGNLNYSWDSTANAFIIDNESGDMATMLGASKPPVWKHLGNSTSESGIPFAYPDSLNYAWGFSGAASYNLQMNEDMYLVLATSSEGLDSLQSNYTAALANPKALFAKVKDHTTELLTKKTVIKSPNTQFNEAYNWALLATDMFLVETPGLGQALVAGYASTAHGWDGAQKVSGRPGYAWYFGRDGQWSSMALLDYGDHKNGRKQLEFYLKFQDVNGKIFHEVSTSGVVHYDASDATPLFIVLFGKYLKHSGDIAFIKENWPKIKQAIDFCYSTDVNNDKLIENVNVGHGWVEGGHLYGSQSTLYLSACWAEALAEAAYMAKAIDKTVLATKYDREALAVRQILNNDFWNSETQFFNHGKYPDGTYNPELTVMPAIPIYFNQVDEPKVMPVLEQFAGNGFTSDWGVRIVPESSKFFNPRGYHTGSVWPLYTGWASMAEYSGGNYLQGFQHVMNNLNVYKNWGRGYVEEVLDGLEYKPMGVCHHQCWSETMALQPLLEGMLGFKPDAINQSLELAPHLPPQWDSLEVSNLRLGETYITMKMKRSNGETEFSFIASKENTIKLSFSPSFLPGTEISEVLWQGRPLAFKVHTEPGDFVSSAIQVELQGQGSLQIKHHGGISILPLLPQPKPKSKSRGFRLIKHSFDEKFYILNFAGMAGNTENFDLYCPDWTPKVIAGAELIGQNGAIYNYRFAFAKGAGYKQLEVKIEIVR